MTLRLPRVWPPLTYLAAALTLHAAVVGGVFYWYVGVLGRRPDETDAVFARTGPVALLAAAVGYAVFRVWAFHPALRTGYRQWLAQTPWESSKPLPLGPVHLTAADAALLGIAFLAAWPFFGTSLVLLPIQAFLAVYLILLCAVLLVTAEWAAAYGIWFGLGAMVLTWHSGWPFVAAAAVAYAAGRVGLHRSLARFPSELPDLKLTSALTFEELVLFDTPRALGWPFGYLAPGAAPVVSVRGHALVLATLVGWTVYVIGTLLPRTCGFVDPELYFLLGFFPVLFVAALRVALCRLHQHRSPITPAGRILTGRWIIPGYDRVFVAPLLAVTVLPFGLNPVILRELDPGVGIAVATALSLWVLLTVGPSRRRWFLTGGFLVRPGIRGRKPAYWV